MSETTGRPRRPAPGFTLLELAIVLTLALVLGVAAMPSFAAMIERHRLKAAIQALQSDITFARQRAVQWRRPLHLQFAPGPEGCWVLATDPDADCRTAVVDDLRILKVAHTADHPGTALLEADPITLTPDAAAMPIRRIVMASPTGRRLTLQSTPLGRFTVCSDQDASDGSVPRCTELPPT